MGKLILRLSFARTEISRATFKTVNNLYGSYCGCLLQTVTTSITGSNVNQLKVNPKLSQAELRRERGKNILNQTELHILRSFMSPFYKFL